MCVSNFTFIKMANEDMNVLDVIYGVEFDVSTSNPQDVSSVEYEDVFKDIDFDCSSELSSLSNEEEDSTKTSEVQTRKHLVIGKHIEVIDGEQKKYKCTICECQFSWKQQIRYHDYCVTGKRPLKCELCDKRFVKKSHLIYHTRTHSGESPYQCPICPKSFKQLAKLKRHEKIHKEPGEADKFQCNICKKNYCDRDSLRKHELKHDQSKTFQCKHCKNKYVDKFTFKQHLATHQVPKFICEVCGRKFRWKNSLNIHLQMHDDVYPYHCTECRKTFRTKKELNQHKVVHDESLIIKDSNEIKKTNPSKQKGKNKINKKKETRKLKRSDPVNNESTESTLIAGPDFSDVADQVLRDNEPESGDRNSVLKTTSTNNEVPVDLSKTESIVSVISQDNEFSSTSPKTSVIVHTSSFQGSLLHEANSRREPVIKFFRPPLEPNSLTPDPT
nr:zinc finger protein 583-like isoform X3 [Halyomorpha halys]